MPRISVEGSKLHVGEHELQLPEEVEKTIQHDEKIVVLLDTLGKRDLPRNVWAVDDSATVQWKIEAADSEKPYTGLWTEDGSLWAYNWNGMAYQINPETGERIGERFMK